jgi:uracil-DNA glycosylase
LLVGSNPSQKSATCDAFSTDTKSGRLLREWVSNIDATFVFENVAPLKTKDNRPLSREEKAHAMASLRVRIAQIDPDRVVALGKTASQVLKKAGLSCFEMEHPSGLNRNLNQKDYVAKKLADLKIYCEQ